jgi:transposase, IS6 family
MIASRKRTVFADRGDKHDDRDDWLNNRVEQDHRRIKRLTYPMLGFQVFWTAKQMLAGVEAMGMLAKGQVGAVPRGDMPAQRAFVQQIFGLPA